MDSVTRMEKGKLSFMYGLARTHTKGGVSDKLHWSSEAEKVLGQSLMRVTANTDRMARALVVLEQLPNKARYANALRAFWKIRYDGSEFPRLSSCLQTDPGTGAFYVRNLLKEWGR